MKTNLLITVLAVGMLSSCSSSFFLTSNTSGEDDIYFNPEKKYVASVSGGDINPLNSKDARIAELQRKMNATMSDTVATSDTVYVEEDYKNPYEEVLVNSASESRERRLKAQSELGFNYSAYNDALWYASAYDPAFYNVVIYGSSVWVEPRWVTSSWYFPHSYFSMGFGSGFGFGYGVYGYGYPYGYGAYNPWNYGWYSGYYAGNYWGYDNYNGYGGYYNGKPSNSGNYHYGRRQGDISTYQNREGNSVRSGDSNYGGIRRRGTTTPVVNSATSANPSDVTVSRRRPGNSNTSNSNAEGTIERRRPGIGNTTVYTRPSTVNQNGRDGYTPTYTRPSGGVRQDYNSSRPTSNGNSGSYERRPATSSGSSSQSSGSSGNSYSRPASSNSGSSYSRPASTSSGSSNTGTSSGTRKR